MSPHRPSRNVDALARFLQLEELALFSSPVNRSRQKFEGVTSYITVLSSVTTSLEILTLTCCELDVSQSPPLVHFTSLHTLSLSTQTITNFNLCILLPTTRCITITCNETIFDDECSLVFPACGQVVVSGDNSQGMISWTWPVNTSVTHSYAAGQKQNQVVNEAACCMHDLVGRGLRSCHRQLHRESQHGLGGRVEFPRQRQAGAPSHSL